MVSFFNVLPILWCLAFDVTFMFVSYGRFRKKIIVGSLKALYSKTHHPQNFPPSPIEGYIKCQPDLLLQSILELLKFKKVLELVQECSGTSSRKFQNLFKSVLELSSRKFQNLFNSVLELAQESSRTSSREFYNFFRTSSNIKFLNRPFKVHECSRTKFLN